MNKHPNLPTALAAAQVQFPAIRKDGEAQAGPRKYKYITLDEINRKCVPVLCENGLVLTHEICGREFLAVLTTLVHAESAASLTSKCPLFVAEGGNRMQALGSARTYAMRYNTGSLLNIAVDFDDDGAGSGGSQANHVLSALDANTASQKEVQHMGLLFDSLKFSAKRRKDWAFKASTSRTNNCCDLSPQEAARVVTRLEEELAKKEAKEAKVAHQDDQIPMG